MNLKWIGVSLLIVLVLSIKGLRDIVIGIWAKVGQIYYGLFSTLLETPLFSTILYLAILAIAFGYIYPKKDSGKESEDDEYCAQSFLASSWVLFAPWLVWIAQQIITKDMGITLH